MSLIKWADNGDYLIATVENGSWIFRSKKIVGEILKEDDGRWGAYPKRAPCLGTFKFRWLAKMKIEQYYHKGLA